MGEKAQKTRGQTHRESKTDKGRESRHAGVMLKMRDDTSYSYRVHFAARSQSQVSCQALLSCQYTTVKRRAECTNASNMHAWKMGDVISLLEHDTLLPALSSFIGSASVLALPLICPLVLCAFSPKRFPRVMLVSPLTEIAEWSCHACHVMNTKRRWEEGTHRWQPSCCLISTPLLPIRY